jgi:hypothetical protein
MTQQRAQTTEEAEAALAETLRRFRAEIVEKHAGAAYRVEDVLDQIDATLEAIESDRDGEIDDAIADLAE